MRFELFGLLFMAILTYAFYVAIGDIQKGVGLSLIESKKTSAHVDVIDEKVDNLVRDVSEMRNILEKEGLWRKKR